LGECKKFEVAKGNRLCRWFDRYVKIDHKG
jgi:uncharacterized protein YodC (DUF2158 family)